jgi:hypothetical protein
MHGPPTQPLQLATVQANTNHHKEDHAGLLAPYPLLAFCSVDQGCESNLDSLDLGRRQDPPPLTCL